MPAEIHDPQVHDEYVARPAATAEPSSAAGRRAPLVLVGLVAALAMLAVLYLTWDIQGSWQFAVELRSKRLIAMVLVGAAIGWSTVLFQTVTHNRILTPSIMGFDALYLLLQTLLVFFFGSVALIQLDPRVLFAIEVVTMSTMAGLLYRWLFGRRDRDLFVLVLVGIVMGTLFSSLTALVTRMIDPNEFLVLQDLFFASFGSIDEELFGVGGALLVVSMAVGWWHTRHLDVVALGRDTAINLGVDHHRVVSRTLIVVAVLVSVSTALVGPITFLGLLVAHLAYQALGTFRHRFTLPAAALIGVIALVGGQLVLEHVLDLGTSLSVIINFVGGTWFIVVLLREARPT